MPNSSALQTLRESIRARARQAAVDEYGSKPSRPEPHMERFENPRYNPEFDDYDERYVHRTVRPTEDDMQQYEQELADWRENVQSFTQQQAAPQTAALDVWQNAREGVEEANQAAMEDREKMLAEIESYEEGYNEDWINETLDREKALWEAKRQQTLQRVQNQYAAMGRTPSPFLMGELNKRLVAQEADALQARRYELEQERAARKEAALRLRHKTYMGTQRQVLDPARATEIVRRLGQAGSNIEAERV